MTSPTRLFAILILLAASAAHAADNKPLPPIRVILAGDSTMASGSGYGDALCARFVAVVKCLNLARAGRSTGSFRSEGFWDQARKEMQDNAGFSRTYVLVQFGHNDQPGKGVHSTDLLTQFPANMAQYAREVKELGGVPVLVTPLTRRSFAGPVLKDNLMPWAEATRRTATAEHALMIDLNRLSADAVQAMGQSEADTLDPDPATLPPGAIDRTHLGPKGAAFFSGMVAGELVRLAPPIKPYLKAAPPAHGRKKPS
jgi:lysophospholipase L1-like esterase